MLRKKIDWNADETDRADESGFFFADIDFAAQKIDWNADDTGWADENGFFFAPLRLCVKFFRGY